MSTSADSDTPRHQSGQRSDSAFAAANADSNTPHHESRQRSDSAHAAGVIELLGMLASGELLAFDRMAADARLAPDLGRRATLGQMAAAEIENYTQLVRRITELGQDPATAMQPFVDSLKEYHDNTEPADWAEALTKAFVGDSISDDFFRAVADHLDPDDRGLVLDVLHRAEYADFAAGEIRALIAEDPSVANRLSMWARRLMGEALSQAQRVSADHPDLAGLVADVPALFQTLAEAHTTRMTAVGLNN